VERTLRGRPEGGRLSGVAPRRLALPAAHAGELRRLAREASPREACGLLLGELDGDLARVREHVRSVNLEARRGRFLVDPAAQLAAERRAEATGLRVLGAWHSHPGGAPEPSPADLAGAAYPLLVVLACGAHGALAESGAWWCLPDGPRRLRVEESAPAPFRGRGGRSKG
jgi:proteasome lid subunit RPN8/RPN11